MPLRPLSEAYFRGLEETYGFPVPRSAGPALVQAAAMHLPDRALRLLQQVSHRLPGPEPDLFVGPLFGIGPATTIAVEGRPAIAVGADKFDPRADRSVFPRRFYHPDELEEMLPHEAAHVVRMRALDLPPTPRRLSLLDMVMLEGTALVFTDSLVGRRTLDTFLSPELMRLHARHERQVLDHIADHFHTGGMDAFLRWFGQGAWPSGYYAGYALCRDYLIRTGAVPVTLPSRAILASLQPSALPDSPRG